MKRPYVDNSMYSGIPCDKCGGPTYRLRTGSIWCSAEDPHPGGHFVSRMGMTPRLDAERAGKPIAPRPIKSPTSAPVQKPSEPKPGFGSGYDDFVRSDDK